MTKFFTGDTHLGHSNILEYTHRPFNTVEEMDNEIIERWNALVWGGDHVYHLGDFAWRAAGYYLDKINGRIHLILGNHDDNLTRAVKDRFESVAHAKYIRVGEQKIWLAHYPHLTWRAKEYGSWHLHGHCHGTMKYSPQAFDVGVDNCGFVPISFEQLQEFMDGGETNA